MLQANSTTQTINGLARPPLPIRVTGPGDPNCLSCHGSGRVLKPASELTGYERVLTEAHRRFCGLGLKDCDCVVAEKRRRALPVLLEHAWIGLSNVDPAPSTLLRDLTKRSVWVRASRDILQAHVARLVLDNPKLAASIKVISDADLYDAEWAPKATKSEDGDEKQKAKGPRLTPSEVYMPPPLLILILGRREQRHKTLAEVCTDACRRRTDCGKVTWIVDDPGKPLDKRHPTWSAGLEWEISSWQHLLLPVVSDPGVLARAWPESTEAAVRVELADKPKAAAAARPKHTAMTAVVEDTIEKLGIKDAKLQEDNGGATGTCPCSGPCSIWEGSGDRTGMIRCEGPKCPMGGVGRPLPAALRLLRKLHADPAARSRGGKVHQWLTEQLSRGPRPVTYIDQTAKDAGISTTSLYRARADIAEVFTDTDRHKMMRLLAHVGNQARVPTLDPPSDLGWDVVPSKVQAQTSDPPKAQVPSGSLSQDDLEDAMDGLFSSDR